MQKTKTFPLLKTGFCSSKKVGIIGVHRDSDRYFYYYFNEKTLMLKPLNCFKCQPSVQEKDLRPLYSVFVEDLQQHVFFVSNQVTDSIEQYIFNKSTGGFEQIHYPALKYEKDTPQSNIICTIQEDENHGKIVIRRNYFGDIEKLLLIDEVENYVPTVCVQTLVMKENFQEDDCTEDASSDLPLPLSDSFFDPTRPFIIQYCKHIQEHIVAIRLSNGAHIRAHYCQGTGKFELMDCIECYQNIQEEDLHPVYTVFHQGTGEHVIFMKNYKKFKIEQYVCREDYGGFEQVNLPDLIFNPNNFSTNDHCFELENSSHFNGHRVHYSTVIQRGENGSVEKVEIGSNGRTVFLLPRLVHTFEVQQRLLEEQRRKEEERNYMRHFPYDDKQEWRSDSFIEFIDWSDFTDRDVLNKLLEMYHDFLTEITIRAERAERFETYNTEEYNIIIRYRADNLKEIETILEDNMEGFVSEWQGTELSKKYFLEIETYSRAELRQQLESDSEDSEESEESESEASDDESDDLDE